MNLFITNRLISARVVVLLTVSSLLLSAFPAAFFVAEAASIGITLDKASATTVVSEQANFVVTVTDDGENTDGTYVSVTDGGNGGEFYNGTIEGQCSQSTPDSDNEFSIDTNKGICYSNATAGVYNVVVQLLDGNGGNPIGDPQTIEITVTDEQVEEEKKIDICHWNGTGFELLNVSVNSIGNAHGAAGVNDGDIIPAFGEYAGQNLTTDYLGETGADILENDCVPTEPPVSNCNSGGIEGLAGGEYCDEPQPVYGCMDEVASNYNPEATEQGEVECVYPDPTDPQYGPYCGDGELNQSWEQCELGESGCTEQCQWEEQNQCTDLTLARINIDDVQNLGEGDMSDDLYIGGLTPVPNGVWFLVHQNGVYEIDADISGYEDVPGLAVERSEGSIRSVLHGSGGVANQEHVDGTVTMWSYDSSVVVDSVTNDAAGGFGKNNGLEHGFNGTGAGNHNPNNDEVWVDSGVANFWLTTTIKDDGFYTNYSEPATDNCPECKAGVEARIISDERGSTGEGHSNDFVLLGDGTTVEYGEWFSLTEDDLGTFITDPENAKKFPDAKNTDGLFVSRNGDGTMDITLVGRHDLGQNTNNEWIRGYVEIRDAEIASVEKLTGLYKFENHPEADDVPTNDNFDMLGSPTNTTVDFDMWVDTKSDGFKVTIDQASIVPCDEDTEETYIIEGYKYQITDNGTSTLAGWNIYAENTNIPKTLATSTDENGYYYFEIDEADAGDWKVTEEVQLGWEQSLVMQNGTTVDHAGDGNEYCDFEIDAVDTYQCDFYNFESTEPTKPTDGGGENDDDDNDNEENETGSRRSSSSGGIPRVPAPEQLVLGESISQCEFLEEYMQIGASNDDWEVTKLQMFLSIVMGYAQPVTGFFGPITDANVKLFQEQYRSEVLDPWFNMGIVPHNNPTGFVYKLTKWKINDIVCPGWDPYPSFEGETLSENVDID